MKTTLTWTALSELSLEEENIFDPSMNIYEEIYTLQEENRIFWV